MSNDQIALGSILAYHARRTPGRLALILGDVRVTFEELDARSTQRARMFAAHGVDQGDFVTVALPNGLEFYETSFAIWKLGAIPNIVSAQLAKPEMEAILSIVRPRLFVGDAPSLDVPSLTAHHGARDQFSTDPLPDAVSPALEGNDQRRIDRPP